MMVVVPTADRVEMHYARTASDWAFTALTLSGFGLLFVWRRRGDEDFGEADPGPAGTAGAEETAEVSDSAESAESTVDGESTDLLGASAAGPDAGTAGVSASAGAT